MTDGAMQPFGLTLNKFLDHAAKWHPNTEVVTARENGSITRIGYAELRQRALCASTVFADLGVAFGDHVATLAWNSQAHVEAWYGIMGMGAVCHTLNPRLTAEQLASMLAQSKATVLIVSADLVDLAKQVCELSPLVSHMLVIDDEGGTGQDGGDKPAVHDYEALLARTEAKAIWGEFDETASSGLCFTSGTTGAPKGVTYTHRSSYLHTLRMLQADVMGLTAWDVILPVVPMFHANAWGLPFGAPATGSKLVLPGRHADGASLARLIESEGVTIAVGVPTVWVGLVDHLDATGGELPSLKRIAVGGAPMPPALMERIEKRLGVTVQTSWGMTELSPGGTFAPLGDPDRRPMVSGRPALGVDLLLTDTEGNALPEQRNTEGHLRVRGAAVIERYFGHEQKSTDENGWFDTGDLARIDELGNLTITGRSKELIKSGGEWINPAEIEAVICALPEVSFAAVIGRSDPKWGERPVLLVEMREGMTLGDDELLQSLRGRVASWWIPDAVVNLPQMPLASTGKVDKIRLKSEYGGS
ncbi:long-chain-fatty-acid--CoA ligase [Emcibacter sp.]|uniref:long-chain-fatty-acid--CoA ligase n=1 Tax=Emcibacter sp. TaxID=1979954 RepID=UPI003A8ED82E